MATSLEYFLSSWEIISKIFCLCSPFSVKIKHVLIPLGVNKRFYLKLIFIGLMKEIQEKMVLISEASIKCGLK
jgi:hypothetical protein